MIKNPKNFQLGKYLQILPLFLPLKISQMNFSEFDIVQIKDIKLDKENEYIFAQIMTRRRKKGFLDISMVLSTAYDSPYYF